MAATPGITGLTITIPVGQGAHTIFHRPEEGKIAEQKALKRPDPSGKT